jgi:hypothetical protein
MTDQENVKSPSSLGALGDTKLYGKIPAYSINEEMKGNLLVLASFYKYLLHSFSHNLFLPCSNHCVLVIRR